MLALAAPAQAARLIQANLEAGDNGSRLVLTLDGNVDYSLDLIDPLNVLLRLPGTVSSAIMPQTVNDPVIESITVNNNSQSLDIIIRTRAQGSTVQPSYSPGHKLVLDFGLPGGQPASASPADGDAVPPQVTSLILGGKADVIYLELGSDKPVKGKVTSQGDVVYLRLENGMLAPNMQISGSDSRVLAMQVEHPNPFSLVFKLSRPLASYNITPLASGLALNMRLGDTKMTPPPPSRPTPAGPARPTTVAAPPARISGSETPEGPAPVSAPDPPGDTVEKQQPPEGLMAPSAAAQVRGGRARGALPPLPPEISPAGDVSRGGLSVGEEKDAEGPPVTVGNRLPQGAALAGRDKVPAPAADLAIAQLLLDEGRYDEALYSFELVLDKRPSYEDAATAHYGLAEAYFRLYQDDISLHFTRILDLYQAAMVNYPDSGHIPRALLMMGRAASLADENYLARAYYNMVNTRYRRSESAAWAQIYTGQLDIAEGNFEQAIKIFEDVLARWPEGDFRKDAELSLLQAYFGMEQWGQAVDLIEDIMRREPNFHVIYPQLLYYMGESLYQLQRYPEAREYLLWAINLNPQMQNGDIILTRIGDTFRYERAYRAATEMYNNAINMFPNSDGGQMAKMRLSEEPEENKEHPWEIFQVKPSAAALQVYREVETNYGDRPVGQLARLKMAVWYYKTAAFAQSLETGMELMREHPDTIFKDELTYVLNLSAVARMQELRDELDAVRLLEEYVRLRPYMAEPESNDMLDKLAWAYEQTGLTDKAAHLFRVLGSRMLYKPEYWVSAARNYFADGKFEDALDNLHEVNLDELPEDAQKEYLFLEGQSYARLGNNKEAVLALLALIHKDPDGLKAPGQVYQNLGMALSHMEGRAQDALNALNLAELAYAKEANNPQIKNPRLLVALQAGLLSRKLGDMPGALTHLELALQLSDSPQDKAPILYEIFLGQRGLGQKDAMMKSLNELVTLKVEPWSSRADSILLDLKLKPELERMGRDLGQSAPPASR